MVSVNLYRYKCTDCGCVSSYPTASEDKECPDCSNASMKYTPSPTHDESIMEEPPDWFECPNCGQRKYGWPLEDGSDWYCREETGGCGYLNWSKNMSGDVPTPRFLMISGFINMRGCGTNCGEKDSSNINTGCLFSGLVEKGS